MMLTLAAVLLGVGVGAVALLTGEDDSELATTAGETEDAESSSEADDVGAANSAPSTPDATAPSTDSETAEGDATRIVDLDGACTAEVDVDVPIDTVRAWEHSECEWAPIDPARDGAWILVVSSLNGDDFGAFDAEQRAREMGLDGRVLWSSHYPSLNPNLWVVYEGPFRSESAASRAASSGSYPRVLSDDPGDRYCDAADGCQGERAR